MRLAHIKLKRLRVEDTSETIEGVVVWQPYGWFAHIVLREVRGPEISGLENLIKGSQSVRFMDGNSRAYDWREEMAWIEVYDREHIDKFVRRGALRDPQILLELGRDLLTRLESELQERRTPQR